MADVGKLIYHRSSAATTTVWLDADPVATGPSTPSCPTGQFIIPLNQTQQINSCIADPDDYGLAWDCMDMAFLGLSLMDFGPGQPYKVAFEDYSNRPQLFQYGPQPPDFNGSTFELSPVKDKEDVELGVAMFFSHLFDKLIICMFPFCCIYSAVLIIPQWKQMPSILSWATNGRCLLVRFGVGKTSRRRGSWRLPTSHGTVSGRTLTIP
jgi:hypothetical protein